MYKDLSLSTFIAGFIAVLVGFASSAALVLQAASAAGASPAETGSWLLAIGLSTTVTSIGLSIYYRIPILTSWSTPGAALLTTSLLGYSMSEAIGAFICSALLILFFGISGIFEKIIHKIPKSLTSAMMAGILIHFCLKIFPAFENQASLIITMFLTYLMAKQFFTRYTILFVLIAGVVTASYEGLFNFEHFHLALSYPIFTMPVFSISAFLNVSIPLFIITMTSQNIPGISVMNNAGYKPPISTLISWTGLGMLLSAPFGGFSHCLAAFTSAICNSEEAHSDSTKRYMATVWAGFFYFITGLFGATIVALFTALPKELMLATGALALLSTISNNLKMAMEIEAHREAALITLLIATSGINLFGINSAFMSLIVGCVALFLLSDRTQFRPFFPKTSRTPE